MHTGAGRPEILFATIAAGGGHVATARAMAEAIERYYPGEFDLRVSDYMKEVGVTGPRPAAQGFLAAGRYATRRWPVLGSGLSTLSPVRPSQPSDVSCEASPVRRPET